MAEPATAAACSCFGSNLGLTGVTRRARSREVGGKGLHGSLAPPPGSEGTPGPGIGGTAAGGAIFTEGAGEGSTTSTLSLTGVSLNNNVAQGGPAGMAKDGSQPAVPGGMTVGGAIEQLEDTTLLLKRTQIQGNKAFGRLGLAEYRAGTERYQQRRRGVRRGNR